MNIDGAMIKNIKQREDIRKPPPDYVGGKLKIDCREQSAVEADDQVSDLEISEGRASSKIWRRSRDAQGAADARFWSSKRGTAEEGDGEKNLRGGAGVLLFRSGVRVSVRNKIRDREYL